MPKITHFIYCLNSIASDEKTDVSGILSAITPSHIPGDFSFSILCSIMNLSDGFHDVEVKFFSPSKKILAKLDGVVPFTFDQKLNVPREYIGVNISANFQNIFFEETGLYKSFVVVDGEEFGPFEIYAKGRSNE